MQEGEWFTCYDAYHSLNKTSLEMVKCLDGNGQITPAVFSWRKRREFCGSSSYSVSVGLALINGGWGACYLAQFTLE